MQMQYWQNETGQVFGYDISDALQVEAMNERLASGIWIDVTNLWPPRIPATAERNKAIAAEALANTDWVNQPDVLDIANNPHLLNRSEFIAYRSALRSIAVNPQAGDLTWPIEPVAQWS